MLYVSYTQNVIHDFKQRFSGKAAVAGALFSTKRNLVVDRSFVQIRTENQRFVRNQRSARGIHTYSRLVGLRVFRSSLYPFFMKKQTFIINRVYTLFTTSLS